MCPTSSAGGADRPRVLRTHGGSDEPSSGRAGLPGLRGRVDEIDSVQQRVLGQGRSVADGDPVVEPIGRGHSQEDREAGRPHVADRADHLTRESPTILPVGVRPWISMARNPPRSARDAAAANRPGTASTSAPVSSSTSLPETGDGHQPDPAQSASFEMGDMPVGDGTGVGAGDRRRVEAHRRHPHPVGTVTDRRTREFPLAPVHRGGHPGVRARWRPSGCSVGSSPSSRERYRRPAPMLGPRRSVRAAAAKVVDLVAAGLPHAEGSLEAEKMQIARSYDPTRATDHVRRLARI